jgi:hypothetical protein
MFTNTMKKKPKISHIAVIENSEATVMAMFLPIWRNACPTECMNPKFIA